MRRSPYTDAHLKGLFGFGYLLQSYLHVFANHDRASIRSAQAPHQPQGITTCSNYLDRAIDYGQYSFALGQQLLQQRYLPLQLIHMRPLST